MSISPPIAVAMDVPSGQEALHLADQLQGVVAMVKVGLELFVKEGPGIVGAMRDKGFDVFLDLKFHDIPNTIAGAVRSASSLDVAIVNIHAAAGPEGMRQARLAANAVTGGRPLVVAVTVLTSHKPASEAEEVGDEVERLAREALICGLDGVVCSPLEVRRVRAACGPGFFIITPGIRPASAEVHDQQRIATPKSALDAGSDLLVVGRPITQAPDPRAAAVALVSELGGR